MPAITERIANTTANGLAMAIPRRLFHGRSLRLTHAGQKSYFHSSSGADVGLWHRAEQLFSVVNTVALKPVPVRNSERIVRLERWFANNMHGDSQYAFSYEEFRYFAEQNRVFASLIATSFPLRVAASLPRDPAAARVPKL